MHRLVKPWHKKTLAWAYGGAPAPRWKATPRANPHARATWKMQVPCSPCREATAPSRAAPVALGEGSHGQVRGGFPGESEHRVQLCKRGGIHRSYSERLRPRIERKEIFTHRTLARSQRLRHQWPWKRMGFKAVLDDVLFDARKELPWISSASHRCSA